MRRKGLLKFSTFYSIIFIFLGMASTFLACKKDSASEKVALSSTHHLLFLDSLAAAQAIVQDQKEGFFEKITLLDLALQIKNPAAQTLPRDSALRRYRAFLAEDVSRFSESEILYVQKAFREIFELCNRLEPSIFPRQIQLIKTKARHYGAGVFYTRERCIVIPADALQTLDATSFKEVMLHEVFHIFSRYQSAKRDSLYALIGFQKLLQPLNIPAAVAEKRLLNPDGIDCNYAIRLQIHSDSILLAVPLIVSNADTYLPGREKYFEYIRFGLYPVVPAEGSYRVIARPDGYSPLNTNELPDFLRQIGDNTLYIIHPDEILADNFKWLVLAQSDQQLYQLTRFSKSGQTLLKNIQGILQSKE